MEKERFQNYATSEEISTSDMGGQPVHEGQHGYGSQWEEQERRIDASSGGQAAFNVVAEECKTPIAVAAEIATSDVSTATVSEDAGTSMAAEETDTMQEQFAPVAQDDENYRFDSLHIEYQREEHQREATVDVPYGEDKPA